MTVTEALTAVRRQDWARLVGGISRITSDPGAAEDCVQEAFQRAWTSWTQKGIPDEPAAWIRRVARNLAIDRWRRARREESFLRRGPETVSSRDDDALGLLFACAHPALNLEAQVALTLRWGAGLDTGTIARSFLVTEDTMTKRLTRAKTKVRESGIPLRVPDESTFSDRLASVLGVLYLLFNHGNDAGPDEADRATLIDEALRLAENLVEGMPQEPEAWGLLSLMLLTAARRPARFEAGVLVTLDRQDRGRWDPHRLRLGLESLTEALSRGSAGPYTLQAAIAGCHARAETAEDTDWRSISGFYRRLEVLLPSPVVTLNRAVAEGRAGSPQTALALLDGLDDPALEAYPYFHAARAEFLDLTGRRDEAEAAWDRAIVLAPSESDRRALVQRRSR